MSKRPASQDVDMDGGQARSTPVPATHFTCGYCGQAFTGSHKWFWVKATGKWACEKCQSGMPGWIHYFHYHNGKDDDGNNDCKKGGDGDAANNCDKGTALMEVD